MGDTRANLVTVALGNGGAVQIRNALGSADVVVDLAGYYSTGSTSRFSALTPSRLLDTRVTGTPLGLNSNLTLPVTGRGGVPGDAVAVVVNLTATDTTAPTAITAAPAGQAIPLASNLNLGPASTRPNLAIVKVGTGGAITLHNMFGSTDMIVDVVGAFGPSGTDLFQPSAPVRILDTRTTLVPSGWPPNQPIHAGQTLTMPIVGQAGIPSNATAVLMNMTATDVTNDTFITIWPNGGSQPGTSDLNPIAGDTAANLVAATLGSGGAVRVFNLSGTVDLVADTGGWFFH